MVTELKIVIRCRMPPNTEMLTAPSPRPCQKGATRNEDLQNIVLAQFEVIQPDFAKSAWLVGSSNDIAEVWEVSFQAKSSHLMCVYLPC